MFQPFLSFLSSLIDAGEEGYEVLLEKPIFLLGRQGQKVGRMFGDIAPVQAVTIYVGILWVIPLALVTPFTSIYMVRLGLSKTEIGVYQSLLQAITPIGYFLGGYLSDVWGRKKTLIVFDILSWGGYCLSLALADSKWWCLAAIFFLATNAGSAPLPGPAGGECGKFKEDLGFHRSANGQHVAHPSLYSALGRALGFQTGIDSCQP